MAANEIEQAVHDTVMSTLAPPADEQWSMDPTTDFALSPDGHRLAVVISTKDAEHQLATRALDRLESSPLPGTGGGSVPFWSPDRRSIGFFADHELKTIDVASGTVRALCPAPHGNAGAWSPRGVILFVPQDATELSSVPAAGGACSKLVLHGITPGTEGSVQFLPDGSASLFDPRNNRSQALFDSPDPTRPVVLDDWSPDGRSIAFSLRGGRVEPWVYDVASGATRRLFAEAGDVPDMRYSPDGRWLAYQSNVTGADEIYLRALPGLSVPIRVSVAGGTKPRWRADSRELYYAAPSGAVLAVTIGATPDAEPSAPTVAVPAPPLGRATARDFDALPDGRRFVFILSSPQSRGLTLVQNWWALLERNAQ